jgi:hypothetical protein
MPAQQPCVVERQNSCNAATQRGKGPQVEVATMEVVAVEDLRRFRRQLRKVRSRRVSIVLMPHALPCGAQGFGDDGGEAPCHVPTACGSRGGRRDSAPAAQRSRPVTAPLLIGDLKDARLFGVPIAHREPRLMSERAV